MESSKEYETEYGVDSMSELSVKLGNGFEFDSNNAITSSWTESSVDGNDIKQSDGLYIPSLKGKDGTGGGTKVDNHTLQESENGGVVINRDVVQEIYTMSVWKVQTGGRSAGSIPFVTSGGNKIVKDITSVKDEINFIFEHSASDPYTSYVLQEGDLLQFVTGGADPSGTAYIHTFTNNAGVTMEDGNRYVELSTVALFVVTSVTPKSGGWKGEISGITLECLWSLNGYYTKGQILSTD